MQDFHRFRDFFEMFLPNISQSFSSLKTETTVHSKVPKFIAVMFFGFMYEVECRARIRTTAQWKNCPSFSEKNLSLN